MKSFRKVVLIICMLLVMVPQTIWAAEINWSLDGKATLTLSFELLDGGSPEDSTQKAKISLYQVEKLVKKGSGQTLEWTTDFSGCGISLENLNTSQAQQAANQLAQYAAAQGIRGNTQSIGLDQKAVYENLDFGTYLVVVEQMPEHYDAMKAFLVPVPVSDQAGWDYQVEVGVKTEKQVTPPDSNQGNPPEQPTDKPTEEPTEEPTEKPAEEPSEKPTEEPSEEPSEEPEKDPEKEPDGEPTKDPASNLDDPNIPDANANPDPSQKLPQTGPIRWPIPVAAALGIGLLLAGAIYKKGERKILLSSGTVLVVAALSVLIYQEQEGIRAGNISNEILEEYEELSLERLEDGERDSESDTIQVEDGEYIGEVSIPSLGITLPVSKDLSYPQLKMTPCRYEGSLEEDSLIIAAHNYASHFGGIKNLKNGDEVVFTDVNGNSYHYMVEEIDILKPDQVEEMKSGDWGLTLFTCTYGGQSRVTVRCSKAS